MRLLLIAALSAAVATAGTFSYVDFSSTSGLTLNGAAAQVGNVLRVAPDLPSQAGTAYYTTPIDFDASTGFSTAFEFLITTADPTDGFTFLLQSQDVTAVGDGGQGAGYVNLSPSVAVLFRGRAPAFIGVVVDGVDPLPGAPAGATPHTEGDFYNQNEFAWIDYDPSSLLLSVYLSPTSTKPGTADMSTAVDIFGTVGPQAFVGFSAGTGGASGNNDILNWSFTTETPEPGTAGIYALGLVGLGLLRRFSKR